MDDGASMDVDFDVVVVGAGVAGCVTAYQLATKGHSVLLVERGESPAARICREDSSIAVSWKRSSRGSSTKLR